MKKYSLALIGGTFDRLHIGHKSFIKSSLSFADNLIIGVTSDEYVQNTKKVKNVLPFLVRKKDLEQFLSEVSARERVKIRKIEKNEIPNSLEEKIDAIVVTQNTLSGAEYLNAARKKKGISPLPIIIVPLIKDSDGDAVSSTRIRKGEIDREGNSFYLEDIFDYSYSLTPAVRRILKKPLGKVIKSEKDLRQHFSDNTVTVGDITTKTFLGLNLHPRIAVIDFIVERKLMFSSTKDLGFTGKEHIYTIEDPASSVSKEVFRVFYHLFMDKRDSTSIIKIIGEEDLIVLPAMLTAPLGASIFYGQPGDGIVYVPVDEKAKKKARNLISRFEKKK